MINIPLFRDQSSAAEKVCALLRAIGDYYGESFSIALVSADSPNDSAAPGADRSKQHWAVLDQHQKVLCLCGRGDDPDSQDIASLLATVLTACSAYKG